MKIDLATHSLRTTGLQYLKIRRNIASLSLSFTVIFMVTALLNLLTACFPPSPCGPAAQGFPLTLIPILSNYLMQELTSFFIPSSPPLVNSGTLFLNLYFPLPMTCTPLREVYQDIYNCKLDNAFWTLFLFCLRERQFKRDFVSRSLFFLPWPPPFPVKKKKKNIHKPFPLPMYVQPLLSISMSFCLFLQQKNTGKEQKLKKQKQSRK